MGIFENLSLSPLSSLLIHPSSAPYTSRPHCTESKNMGTNRPSSRCGLRRHRSPSRSRFSNKVVGLRGRTLGEKSSLKTVSAEPIQWGWDGGGRGAGEEGPESFYTGRSFYPFVLSLASLLTIPRFSSWHPSLISVAYGPLRHLSLPPLDENIFMSSATMAFGAAEPSASVVLSPARSCHMCPEAECQASSKRYSPKPCPINRAYLKYRLLSVGKGSDSAGNNAGSCVQVPGKEMSPRG